MFPGIPSTLHAREAQSSNKMDQSNPQQQPFGNSFASYQQQQQQLQQQHPKQTSFNAHQFSTSPTGQMDNSNAFSSAGGGYTEISWKKAFGTGGLPGESSLMDELGINLSHICSKSLSVLNPVADIQRDWVQETDLAGPLLISVLFPIVLLFSGKVHFNAIYGIAVTGTIAGYMLMNAMAGGNAVSSTSTGSPLGSTSISVYQTASILGYCMIPILLLAFLSALIRLRNGLGYCLGVVAVGWSAAVASKTFVAVLGMKNQFFLVAYPLLLLYGMLALLTIF